MAAGIASTGARALRAAGHAAALGALALGLAACGGPAPAAAPVQGPVAPKAGTATAAPSDGLTVVPTAEGYNVADVVFLQQMIGHHQLAIQLARSADARSQSAPVRALADTVLAESDSEDTQMTVVLSSLGIDAGTAVAGGHSHSGGPTAEDVAALATKSGTAFDTSFVDLMTEHSLGATQLARAEAAEGSNTALKQFAAAVATRESDRTVELAELPS